jgi:hypothetical protein
METISTTTFREYAAHVGIWNILVPLGLLASTATCSLFEDMCHLQSDGRMREHIFRCKNRSCRKKQSARVSSFFNRWQIRLQTIMTIILMWLHKDTPVAMCRETGVSGKTITTIIHELRRLIVAWMAEQGEDRRSWARS